MIISPAKMYARLWMLTVLGLIFSAFSESLAEAETVRIGVLAKRGTRHCLAKWSPTADYLTRKVPGKEFEIIPIDFKNIIERVENGDVDFILANSAIYVELEMDCGVNRIATLKNKRLKGTHTTFGGVIFCRKDRSDLKKLEDLKGGSFMAVEENSFGGWRMAWRELKEAGIDAHGDFKSLSFGRTHDAVVYAVMNGKVDAGTVRTDTLERMSMEGKVDLDDFYIFHEHRGMVHLPFLHSTREYPEWPIAKVSHTPDSLAEDVAVSLIGMDENSKPAIAASCSGWTIPLNYQSVHDCLKYLKVGPYKNLGRITLIDVIKKYRTLAFLILALFSTMAVSMVIFMRMNRNIKSFSAELEHEIDERRNTEVLLKDAKAEAENANETKGMFLANMSHEIRTPMNAIIGMSHLCLGTDLSMKQRHYIEKVHQSSRLLLGIINDILDISKIEAGKLELESIVFELDDVLGNLSNMISVTAQEKGLEVLFDVAPDTPGRLIGDPLRLGQILLNLAGNAVKFTDTGEVVVRIRPLQMDDKGVVLEVMVRDTGIGMTKEQTAGLFEAFTQADATTTRKFGGTGLGLTISRHLVGQMNGQIWVESEPGRGSRFYFTVEMGRGFETVDLDRAGCPVDLEQMKVLVVDDVASVRAMFAATLESFSFRVTCVSSGQEALEELESAPADDPYRLVLMDYIMPEMDGLEASRKIKDSPRLAEVTTLIMVTSLGKDEVMDRAEKIGLEGFLTKPVTPSDLLDTIVGAVGKAGGFRMDARSSGHWKIKTLESIKGARVLLVEDNSINQMVAQDLLVQAGIYVDIANNGVEAVEMISEEVFDAVLMDINMPEMDGYEATRIIRSRESGAPVPIIAMTANAMAGDREKCLDAGMDDHVGKPIDPKVLFQSLVRWIPPGDRSIAQALPVSELCENEAEPFSLELSGVDTAAGLQRTGNNHSLYMDLLSLFAKDHDRDHLLITRAIEQGDLETARRVSHTLKGVSGSIGANALYETVTALDTAIKEGQYQTDEFGQLMGELAGILTPLINDISDKISDELSVNLLPDEAESLDAEAMAELIEAFETLAREMDPDAEDKARLIQKMLYSSNHPGCELGDRLCTQASDLDFQEALETVEKLRLEFIKTG